MPLNQAVADCLRDIARMQELLGEEKFKAVSHERAARAVEDLADDVAALVAEAGGDTKAACERLKCIEGIGPKTAEKIVEFVRTGRIRERDELAAKVPAGLLTMMQIPGLGPKTVAMLWNQRGITDIAALKAIIADKSILELPRMGEKAVAKIAESISLYEQGASRLHIGPAFAVADRFVQALKKVNGVEKVEAAGSLRRGKETVGDIDILVAIDGSDPQAAARASEAFRKVRGVTNVLVAGDTRASVRAAVTLPDGPALDEAATVAAQDEELARAVATPTPADDWAPAAPGQTIQVDLRVLPIDSWGAALMYFTGSKEHNVRLRERAQRMGWTLTDYGLFPEDGEETPPHTRGVKPLAARTEEEIFAKLGLAWVPPEMREDRGELEVKETPRLIEVGDIEAELHAHTTASDGRLSIEQLAEAAKARGFHTIAVTDHSKSSAIAGGLSVDRLMQHIEAVKQASARVKGITILCGSEVDILSDGSLDYEDDVLAQLDVVVASPHAALTQDAETATKRLLRAMSNRYVHILGHPTGRLINRRAGLSPDMGKIIAAAAEHGVALEINSHWMRLDIRDQHVRQAMNAKAVLIAIDCDVHEREDFDNLRFGVQTGRRGWLTPERCINTWPAAKLHAWLKAKRA